MLAALGAAGYQATAYSTAGILSDVLVRSMSVTLGRDALAWEALRVPGSTGTAWARASGVV